jgi:DNA polymerase III sliding clamp (beta) subunit (PCNA family)
MKIKISVSLFNKELDKLISVVNSNNILNTPIFKNMLVDVFNDSMTIIVSNGFFSYKAKIQTDEKNFIIEKTGSFLIGIKQINELMKKITEKFVAIELVDQTTLVIGTPKSRFTIFTREKDNYPTIDFEKIENPNKTEHDFFKTISKKVAFAADEKHSQTNPALKGVSIQSVENKTSVIASNTHRLSKTELETIKTNVKTIVKPSTFALVSKIFSKNEDIYIGLNQDKTQI